MHQGNAGHGVQAGVAGEEGCDGVEGHGAGGDITVDAAAEDDVEAWFAIDDNAVLRVALADGGLKNHGDERFTEVFADGGLANAGGATGADGAEAAGHFLLGFNGFDGFVPVVDLEAEVVGDEVEGFAEADMAEPASRDAGGEGLVVERGADLLLEGDAAGGGVLNAVDLDALHRAANGGGEDGDHVHHGAGVDAGAEEAAAIALGKGVEFFAQFGMAEPGPDEFFAGADDGNTLAEEGAEGVGAEAEVGTGGDESGVDGLPVGEVVQRREHPGGALNTGDEVADALADHAGINVNGGDDSSETAAVKIGNDLVAEGAETDVENAEHAGIQMKRRRGGRGGEGG